MRQHRKTPENFISNIEALTLKGHNLQSKDQIHCCKEKNNGVEKCDSHALKVNTKVGRSKLSLAQKPGRGGELKG